MCYTGGGGAGSGLCRKVTRGTVARMEAPARGGGCWTGKDRIFISTLFRGSSSHPGRETGRQHRGGSMRTRRGYTNTSTR